MTDPLKAERFTWLASYPKSGNTYLRLLIQAYLANGYVDINSITASVGDNTSFWFQSLSPVSLDKLTFNMKLLLRPAALLNQLHSINTSVRFIKTHHANAMVNGQPHLIPADLTERAVYIVRDPRDVVSSLKTYMASEKGLSIDESAEKMADPEYAIQSEDGLPQILTSWSQHVKSWMGETRYPIAILRYEDLCAEPEKNLTELLQFCGLEVDENRVQSAVEACRIANLSRQEQVNGFREDRRIKVRKPFFYKGGSRWRNELLPEIARKIESDHMEMMQRFGYLDSEVAVA